MNISVSTIKSAKLDSMAFTLCNDWEVNPIAVKTVLDNYSALHGTMGASFLATGRLEELKLLMTNLPMVNQLDIIDLSRVKDSLTEGNILQRAEEEWKALYNWFFSLTPAKDFYNKPDTLIKIANRSYNANCDHMKELGIVTNTMCDHSISPDSKDFLKTVLDTNAMLSTLQNIFIMYDGGWNDREDSYNAKGNKTYMQMLKIDSSGYIMKEVLKHLGITKKENEYLRCLMEYSMRCQVRYAYCKTTKLFTGTLTFYPDRNTSTWCKAEREHMKDTYNILKAKGIDVHMGKSHSYYTSESIDITLFTKKINCEIMSISSDTDRDID